MRPGEILFGKYLIDEKIGEGSSAEVFRVTHVQLGDTRVLKLLRRGAPGVGSTEFTDYRQRFQKEARLGARLGLDNPYLVRVFDFEDSADQMALVMEYAAGGSLEQRLEPIRAGWATMPIDEVVRLARDVAAGIAELHRIDVVHRDLKPSNILFDATGRAKVADLGLAQLPGGQSQRSILGEHAPRQPGTPGYMSPEQEASKAYLQPASDVYAFGIILMEMLTGRAFRNLPPATRCSDLRPEVPEWLDALVAGMLADDPKARPWDASVVQAALAAACPPPEEPSSLTDKLASGFRRATAAIRNKLSRRLLRGVAVGASVGLFALVVADRWRPPSNPNSRPTEVIRVDPRGGSTIDSYPGADDPQNEGNPFIQVALADSGVPPMGDAAAPTNPFVKGDGRTYQRPSVIVDSRATGRVTLHEAANLPALEAAYGLRLTPAERAFLEHYQFVIKRVVDTDIRPYSGNQSELLALYEQVAGDWCPHDRLPHNSVLLTSDLFLHSYHNLHQALVTEVEDSHLFPALKRLTITLLAAAAERHATAGADPAALQRWSQVQGYFAVPHCILANALAPFTMDDYERRSPTGEFRSADEVYAEFLARDAEADRSDAAIACLDYLSLDPDVKASVKSDLNRIYTARAGFATPALFNHELAQFTADTGAELAMDFALFLPRGTYTASSMRRQYLRALTWYQQVPFLTRSPGMTDYALAIAELLAADDNAMRDYAQIDQALSFLVGSGDDLSPLDYIAAAKSAAAARDPEAALAAYLRRAATPSVKGLAARFQPTISEQQRAVATTKGMRFFPPRYTLDNYWLHRLTQGDEPLQPGYEQKLPPIASSLQIMTLLGSSYAREQLPSLDFYRHDNRLAIEQALDELASEGQTYADGEWQSNAYALWLWTLRGLLDWHSQQQTQLPGFAQSPAWSAKLLQTASGSWTELRHVSVLNTKQVFATNDPIAYAPSSPGDWGGGSACYDRAIPAAPRGYIEPAPEMLSRLGLLAATTLTGLTDRGYLDLANLHRVEAFVQAVDLASDLSRRQLAFEALREQIVTVETRDDEEPTGICVQHYLDGSSDWEMLRHGIVDKLSWANNEYDTDPRAAFIADLMVGGDADFPERVLYQGTGVPSVMVALVRDAAGPRAVIGFVYSHYELLPNNVGHSITDEAWQRRFYHDADEDGYNAFDYTDSSRWPSPSPWYRVLSP